MKPFDISVKIVESGSLLCVGTAGRVCAKTVNTPARLSHFSAVAVCVSLCLVLVINVSRRTPGRRLYSTRSNIQHCWLSTMPAQC